MENETSTRVIVKIDSKREQELIDLVTEHKGIHLYSTKEIEKNGFLYKVYSTTQRWRLKTDSFEFLLALGIEDIYILSEENGNSYYESTMVCIDEYEGKTTCYFQEITQHDSVIEMWEDFLTTEDETMNEIVNEEIEGEIEYRFDRELEEAEIADIEQLHNRMEHMVETKEQDFFVDLCKERKELFFKLVKDWFGTKGILELAEKLNPEKFKELISGKE